MDYLTWGVQNAHVMSSLISLLDLSLQAAAWKPFFSSSEFVQSKGCVAGSLKISNGTWNIALPDLYVNYSYKCRIGGEMGGWGLMWVDWALITVFLLLLLSFPPWDIWPRSAFRFRDWILGHLKGMLCPWAGKLLSEVSFQKESNPHLIPFLPLYSDRCIRGQNLIEKRPQNAWGLFIYLFIYLSTNHALSFKCGF